MRELDESSGTWPATNSWSPAISAYRSAAAAADGQLGQLLGEVAVAHSEVGFVSSVEFGGVVEFFVAHA